MDSDVLKTRRTQLSETAAFLQKRIQPFPTVAVTAGTGLDTLVADLDVDESLSYSDIPNFPVSTVDSHAGRLAWGTLEDRRVLVFQGRFHLYEGYTPWQVTFPLRVAGVCGLRTALLTNAAGGLNPGFRSGDLMVITDHINLTGRNPLTGPHAPEFGDRFPDMSCVYDPLLRELALTAADKAGLAVRQGVYAGVHGPCLETPAETRFFRSAGADAIGMSTVQEAMVAVQIGLRVLGVSVITNMNLPDEMRPVSLESVINTARTAAPGCARILRGLVARLPTEEVRENDRS